MIENTSVICRGSKTFVVTKKPYSMRVFEQTPEGDTIKRMYTSPNDISPADRMDFLLARIVDNFRQKSK
ncbi:MAG: hypothetical protein J5742_03925 [Alphaproteobacteria bacterium]|nr:hypothetical protein [Alphaproteobacteria bacterium]